MSTFGIRRIGDLAVSAIGMGAMTLTQVPEVDVERGIRTVGAALDAGITLFDTADSYGGRGVYGENEEALISALGHFPGALDHVIVATKGGHTRHENASWWVDGSPEHLAKAARASLGRLGLEALPLYHLHRPDRRYPFVESLEALRQLVDDGIVVRLGVSNVDREQLLTASRVLGDSLVSVQNELSPSAPDDGGVVDLAGQLGLALLAWGPFGGMRAAKELGTQAGGLQSVADARGVSPHRVALAWLLACAPHVIPLPGASRPESIRDAAAAVGLQLQADELRAIAGEPQ